jgi:hypothetical protein
MPRNFWFIFLFVVLTVTVLGVARNALPAQAANAAVPRHAAVASGATEVWKLGLTLEGAASYANAAGRLASPVAAFRSANATDIYFAFPPAAVAKTIQSAQLYLVQRSGSYSGAASLSLQSFSLAGVLQRTVSASTLDVQTATTGAWTALTLSGTPANLQLNPGEYLAFHLTLSGAAGGDLDVRSLFEVGVQ